MWCASGFLRNRLKGIDLSTVTPGNKQQIIHNPALEKFLAEKSSRAVLLFNHIISEFEKAGPVSIHPAKTMIGIATPRKRIAYVTQFGKKFIHVVFPFDQPYPENLCF